MRKFLVLLITIILFIGIIGMPVKNAKADSSTPVPDIVTDKILILSSDPYLLSNLKDGTFGIVSFSHGQDLGFDIPGGNMGVDLLIKTNMVVPVTTPVGLKLVGRKLYVFFSKRVNIVALPWNLLSTSPELNAKLKHSYFPYYVSAQIVKIEDTGARQGDSIYYKIYLTTVPSPYDPPLEGSINIIVEVMVPDYLLETVKTLAKNGDYFWIGVNYDYQIYFGIVQ